MTRSEYLMWSCMPKMTAPTRLRDEWDRFIATLGEEGLRTLREAGIDPTDPTEVADVRFHRTLDTTDCNSASLRDERNQSYFEKVTKKNLMQEYVSAREHFEDPLTVFSIQIARMVVDAFDCSKSMEVRFHCDCIRLALGDASMGSQKAVCERYGVSKATLSWHVRKIQRRLNLPKCIFNGNRMQEGGRK